MSMLERGHRLAAAASLLIVAAAATSCGKAEPPAQWMDRSADAYSKENLTAALDRVDAWLAADNPVARAALQPGVAPVSATELVTADGCDAPRELLDLWDWHDGMRADTDVPLVWYHRFLGVEEAIERRKTYRNPVLRMMLPLPADWIPVLEFEGEFFFVRCDANDSTGATVWYWSGEEPEIRRVYRSLTAMIETSAEWYEQDAVWTADATLGVVDADIALAHEIFVRLNPGMSFPWYVPDS